MPRSGTYSSDVANNVIAQRYKSFTLKTLTSIMPVTSSDTALVCLILEVELYCVCYVVVDHVSELAVKGSNTKRKTRSSSSPVQVTMKESKEASLDAGIIIPKPNGKLSCFDNDVQPDGAKVVA